MKEYWVNVYDQSIRPLYAFSRKHESRSNAIAVASINATYCCEKLLYRLHVKLKEPEPYIQRYGRIVRPKYERYYGQAEV